MSLILADPAPTELDQLEDMTEQIFAAGCDDCVPGTRNGVIEVSFCREGDSLDASIRSATNDLRKAGYTVDRVEIDSDQVKSILEAA